MPLRGLLIKVGEEGRVGVVLLAGDLLGGVQHRDPEVGDRTFDDPEGATDLVYIHGKTSQ